MTYFLVRIACAMCIVSTPAMAFTMTTPPPLAHPVNALPDLTVNGRTQPAYALNPRCAPGQGAITFHLDVRNTGSGASPAIASPRAVWIQDIANPAWASGAALPALQSHLGAPINVTLPSISPASTMAGHHVFKVAINGAHSIPEISYGNNEVEITADIPAEFCMPKHALAQINPAVTGPASPSYETRAKPGPLSPVVVPSGASNIPPPQRLTYTNSPQVCAAHIHGLGAALVCPGIIAGATVLPLVWDWTPCTTRGCPSRIDGYHIYRVTGFRPNNRTISFDTRHLVDTQPDANTTIRGISPFSKTDCFVVTAFRGSQESASSNMWCGAQNLPMGSVTQEYPASEKRSITGRLPTACAPHANWSIVEGTVNQGAFLPSSYNNPCHATEVWYGYYGFKFDVPGGVQKAILHLDYSDLCQITGVVKTSETSWFATTGPQQAQPAPRSNQPQALSRPNISQPISPIPVDVASERDFASVDVDHIGVGSGQATADVTGWFSGTKAASYTFGVAFHSAPTTAGCVASFVRASIIVTYYPGG